MKKTLYIVLGVIVVALIVIGIVFAVKNRNTHNQTSSASATNGQHLKVGVILPLTGDLALTGEKLNQGVQLAEAQFSNQNVDFVVEDSHSTPTDAVSAASKLLNVDKVNVIVGTYSPDETIAVAPLAQKQNEDVFSFSFCSDSFTSLENVFCGYPTADKQLDTVIPLIQKKGIKTMAFVDSNSDFGIQSRDVMVAKAAATGYSVVYSQLVPSGAGDYRTFATKVIATNPDAVFVAMDDPIDALTVVKQLKQLGYKGTAITFIDVDNKNLQQFGSYAEGTFAPGIAPSQFSSNYTAMYKAKFNQDPDYVSALGYDMTSYVTKAMLANPSKDAKTAVLNYTYANPAIANFSFLPDRTVVYQLELQMAQNEQYVTAQY